VKILVPEGNINNDSQACCCKIINENLQKPAVVSYRLFIVVASFPFKKLLLSEF